MASLGFFVFVIVAISLIAAAVVLGVKYFKYRRHISNVLNGVDEKEKRISSPGEAVSWVLVALLILWNGINLTQISLLQSSVNSLNSRMGDMQRDMSINATDISYKLEQIYSPVKYASMALVSLDEDMTAHFELTLELKEYSDDTKVSVRYGEKSYDLTGINGVYTGEVARGLFEEPCGIPSTIVSENGVNKVASVPEFEINALWEELLPSVYASKLPHEAKYSNGVFKIDSEMWVNKVYYKDGVDMTDAYVLMTINGEEVEKIPVNLAILESQDKVVIDLNKKYDVKDGDLFVLYTVCENSLGYSVRQMEWFYKMGARFPEDSDHMPDAPYKYVYKTGEVDVIYGVY
ncbi:MAG: hypothetical protein J6X36_06010 [Lachnospiraceae bacterium]|nr:hypothetical protein [Lachnospiraceae bacterium]